MKKKKLHWLRHMRTTAERRANCGSPYVRAKRRTNNLPDAYDDKLHGHQKSWKMKRETQYHADGRGKRHETIIKYTHWWNRDEWDFRDYCEKNNIPHAVENIYEMGTGRRRVFKRVVDGVVPKYYYYWTRVDGKVQKRRGHQIGWEKIYKTVDTGKSQTYTYKYTVAYKLIWWSDKDIGISYILKNAA